jgi:hypothetical protein
MVPTERSIPPVIITKVAPKARTPFTVAASKIPFTFGIVKKFSEAIEKKITLSTKEPKANGGYFTLELSSDYGFNSIIYSAITNYAADAYIYGSMLSLSGDVNTKYYYRVKNNKDYTTICGNVINSYVYSDIIPITIASNSINSY